MSGLEGARSGKRDQPEGDTEIVRAGRGAHGLTRIGGWTTFRRTLKVPA